MILLTGVCACVLPLDRQIRHRACALKDTVHAIIRDELDEDFAKICEEIKESQRKRGEAHCICKHKPIERKVRICLSNLPFLRLL